MIYVLELDHGKFFVGRAEDPAQAFKEHQRGVREHWTQTYRPVRIVEELDIDAYGEDATVLRYMNERGIENVRGGSYSSVELTFDQCLSAHHRIRTAQNLCYACGSDRHYIKRCDAILCYRCGRSGHVEATCECRTHALNGSLDGCRRCGRAQHSAFRCNRSHDVFGRPLGNRCIVM